MSKLVVGVAGLCRPGTCSRSDRLFVRSGRLLYWALLTSQAMSTSQHLTLHIEAFTTRVTEGEALHSVETNLYLYFCMMASDSLGNTQEVSELAGQTGPESMDGLESVTYFIAGLGVVVLSLCVVVAGLLIYQYCRSEPYYISPSSL